MGVPALIIGLILLIFGVRKLREVPTIETPTSIYWVEFTADSKFVLLRTDPMPGAKESELSKWDLETRQMLWRRPIGPDLKLISPDGASAITINNKRVQIVVTETGKPIAKLAYQGSNNPVWINSHQIMTRGDKPAIWQALSGKLSRTLPLDKWFAESAGLSRLRISPDGTRAAALEELSSSQTFKAKGASSHSQLGRLVITSWPAGKKLATAPGNIYGHCGWTQNNQLRAVTHVMSGGEIHRSSILTMDGFSYQTRWLQCPDYSPSGLPTIPSTTVLSRDGEFFAMSYGNGGVLVMSAEDGSLKHNIQPFHQNTPLPGQVTNRFTPDGKILTRSIGNKLELHALK